MPAPTVKCSICNETVLKARTRHIGDGKRACKIHDGIMDIAEEVHAGQLENIAKKRKAERQRHRRRDPEQISTELRCNICQCSAVKVSDILRESLLISKELEIEGHPGALLAGMLDGDDTLGERLRAKFPGKTGLYVYTKEELGDQWPMVVRRTRRALREGIRMFGFVGICVNCVRKLKIPDKMANLPQPPLETMTMLGCIDRALTKADENRRKQSMDERVAFHVANGMNMEMAKAQAKIESPLGFKGEENGLDTN